MPLCRLLPMTLSRDLSPLHPTRANSKLRLSSKLIASVLVLSTFTLSAPRAHAESKDMIQLQTQVQQLMDAVARLQQANDERMGVLRSLVQQTADSVNKMSATVSSLQTSAQAQQDAASAKSDQLSGQIQSLNDSLDELKARLGRMEKSLGAIQSQQQSTAAILGNLPQAGAPADSPAAPTAAPVSRTPAPGSPIPATGPVDNQVSQPAPVANGPSSTDMYRAAYSDYMSGKYPVALSEFNDLIRAYPDDNLSGNAYFYVGEIDLRTQKPTAAVHSYDHLLEHYPDNNKIPAAHLHKAEAMLSMKQNEGAIREFRALIQRFPNSPEAAQARSRLSSLHVSAGAAPLAR
jgi:tol-pal system protein YbgF